MQETEFRGKFLQTNEWVYGDFHKHQNRTLSPIGDSLTDKDFDYLIIRSGFSDWNMPKPIECIKVVPEAICQYIGIKDIHQKKVFQGDIVKVKETVYTDCSREEIEETREFTGEVVWHQFGWHVAEKAKEKIEGKTYEYIRYHSLWLWNIECEEDDTMEILGDRYSNPEMKVIK